MFQASEDQGTISFTLSSEAALVDRVVAASKDYLAQFGVTHLADITIVLRELLINAIEHGNGNDRSKTVTCTICNLGATRFQLIVEDQGAGFAHGACDFTMPKSGETRHRGLPLVNSSCDELEFNERGNRVTAFMTILNPTGFPLVVEGDTAVITPSGDLTAASADTLRRLLLTETDNGRRRFRFDLGQVRDLDSVSLSVLVAFAQLLRATGAPYVIGLVNCSEDLLSLFRLTRLDQDFMFTLVARA